MIRKLLFIITALFAALFFCRSVHANLDESEKEEERQQINVSLEMEVGTSEKLGDTPDYSIQEDDQVEWQIVSMTNECVSLSEDGVVTAENPGDAVIIADIQNGPVLHYEIHVYTGLNYIGFDSEEYYIRPELSIDIWEYLTVSPNEYYGTYPLSVTSSTDVIEVEGTNLIPRKKGTSVISVETDTGLTASAVFNVGNYADYIDSEDAIYNISDYDSLRLEYTLSSKSGAVDFSDEEVTWSVTTVDTWTESDNPPVILKEDGLITGQTLGQAFVVASIKNGESFVYNIVVGGMASIIRFPTSNPVIPSGTTASIRDFLIINQPEYFTSEFSVKSSNPEVIRAEGELLTALKDGVSLITVRNDDNIVKTHIFFAGENTCKVFLQPGETKKLDCGYLPDDPDHIKEPVTWVLVNSGDNYVKMTDDGVVIGNEYGSSGIMCTVQNYLDVYYYVTVGKELQSFSFKETENYMCGKSAYSIHRFLDIQPAEAENYRGFKVTSDNPEVLKIEGNDRLTAQGKIGTATITVQDEYGQKASAKFITGHYGIMFGLENELEKGLNMVPGQTAQLEYSLVEQTYNPYTDQAVWTTSEDKVYFDIASMTNNCISVDQSGFVTALRNGEACVRVHTKSGFSKDCPIHVAESPVSISFNNQHNLISYDGFTFNVYDYLHFEPSGAAEPGLNIFSDNNNIIEPGLNGMMYVRGKGTATVTAEVPFTNLKASAVFEVGDYGFRVEFDQEYISLLSGEEKQISYLIGYPDSDYADDTVKWEIIAGKEFADVDQTGKVIGKKAGHAIVRALLKTGIFNTIAIYVNEPSESLEFEKETVYVSEKYRDPVKVDVYPLEASDADLKWSISDPSVAKILKTCRNTADLVYLKEGTAVLKAESMNDPTVYAECTVICYKPVSAEKITVADSYTGYKGYDLTIRPEFTPGTADRSFVFSLNNNNAIGKDSMPGELTLSCVRTGNTQVTLKSKNSPVTASAELNIQDIPDSMVRFGICEGNAKTDANPVYEENAAEYTLYKSFTYTFRMQHLETDQLKWNSDDLLSEELMACDFLKPVTEDDGIGWQSTDDWKTTCLSVFEVVKEGTFNLQTAEGRTVKINVIIPDPSAVAIDGVHSVHSGTYIHLKASVIPSGADQKVTWKSLDSSVASVDSSGKVIGRKTGETVITATAVNGVSAQFSITVLEEDLYRIAGSGRYQTSMKIADAYREEKGIDQFDNVIVASGNNFADALAGSYLSYVKKAPILITAAEFGDTKPYEEVNEYIKSNLKKNGTVYVLGGEGAVPNQALAGLESFEINRLSGKNRFETNMEILKEAGVDDEEILIATGFNFADSLSASALNRPILLVDWELSENQLEYLSTLHTKKFYILGGTNAVTVTVEEQLRDYGSQRLSGKGRHETSVLIAEQFCNSTEKAVLAYSFNFPDGLCAGPLALAMNAPLILTEKDNYAAAEQFCNERNITSGYVTGGTKLISDQAAMHIFSAVDETKIVKK